MKKLLFLFVLAVLSIVAISSCTKDTSVSLKGTKWNGGTPANSTLPATTITISFSQTDFEMTITAKGEEGFMKLYGDYSYISPDVVLHAVTSLDSDGTVISQKGVSYSGTVQGNHMTLFMGSAMVNFTLK